jgi:hypothetical protein
MALSLSTIQTTFGGTNPISLSEYYQGGSYVSYGINPDQVPLNGTISISEFFNVPSATHYGNNQFFQGNQNNCGASWTLDYINGYFGWGLYITVCHYTDGRIISPEINYACSQELCFKTINQTVYADGSGSTPGRIINRNPDSRYGDGINFVGVINGYWDGSNIYVTGNTGGGGPGDTGYAYATALTRSSWSVLCGGGNTLVIPFSTNR